MSINNISGTAKTTERIYYIVRKEIAVRVRELFAVDRIFLLTSDFP